MTTKSSASAAFSAHRLPARPSGRAVLLVTGTVLGAACVLGACGSGTTPARSSRPHQPAEVASTHRSSAPRPTTTKAKPTTTKAKPTTTKAKPTTAKTTSAPSHEPPARPTSLESLGAPKVDSGCGGPGTGPLYQVATNAHPFSALNAGPKGWLPSRAVTAGFETVGGGGCTTILTWSLPPGENLVTADVYLGAEDATGSAVSFKVNGEAVSVSANGATVSTVCVGPQGASVSVDLDGAHTFSFVVPGNPKDKIDGPQFIVVAGDRLS